MSLKNQDADNTMHTYQQDNTDSSEEKYYALKRKFDKIDWDEELVRKHTFEALRAMNDIFCECSMNYYQANSVRELFLEILHTNDSNAIHKFFADVNLDPRNYIGGASSESNSSASDSDGGVLPNIPDEDIPF